MFRKSLIYIGNTGPIALISNWFSGAPIEPCVNSRICLVFQERVGGELIGLSKFLQIQTDLIHGTKPNRLTPLYWSGQ